MSAPVLMWTTGQRELQWVVLMCQSDYIPPPLKSFLAPRNHGLSSAQSALAMCIPGLTSASSRLSALHSRYKEVGTLLPPGSASVCLEHRSSPITLHPTSSSLTRTLPVQPFRFNVDSTAPSAKLCPWLSPHCSIIVSRLNCLIH